MLSKTDRVFQAQKITNWVDPKDKTGEFKRGQSQFRNFIQNKEGAEFPAEAGRYHLYVSYACPWGEFVHKNMKAQVLIFETCSPSDTDCKEAQGT